MKCNTIDEVVIALDQIVEDCKKRNDALGYFAVLYRKVTLRVKQGIAQYEFENGKMMAHLDVVFANRYFEAYEAYRQQKPCSQSWKIAFDACQESRHIILQHLLTGINAHINLDLGIAALDTAGNTPLETIYQDFNNINGILGEMVEGVKKNLGSVSPTFMWLIPLAPKTEEMLINFSIETARDGAWKFANELHASGRSHSLIQERDTLISMLVKGIRKPGFLLSFLVSIIGMFEWRSVRSNLKIMER